MNRVVAMVLACALACASAATAYALPPHGMGMGRPRFLDELFPPRLVMQYQADIALTPSQRDAITKAMADAQSHLTDLQWQFEERSTALAKLLAQPTVDAAAALELAEGVMQVEHDMKKTHLALLIAIKNQLDPAQQAQLRALRGHDRRGAAPAPSP